jgi:methyltransferase (TIGR00027 family)
MAGPHTDTAPLVSNVSDTARWVATYRAEESARPDALFKDPFAQRLAGDQGRAIAKAASRHMRNGWPIIVRTKVIDDLLAECIRGGADRVLNLAAGLDSRPYRLSLPPSLTWIEADLPAMVEEKERLFEGEKPACSLTREKVDLADDRARTEFLDGATRGAEKAVVLTEGLLAYLTDDVVRGMSTALRERGSVAWWIFDLASRGVLDMMRKGMREHLDNAPMHFAPANGVAFFEALGWRVLDVRSSLREAAHLRRLPWQLWIARLFPDANPRDLGPRTRWSGIVRLGR